MDSMAWAMATSPWCPCVVLLTAATCKKSGGIKIERG